MRQGLLRKMVLLIPSFILNLIGKSIIYDFIIFLVALFILMWAAGKLVSNLQKVSNYLRISVYVIAFILMGFITSIPELFLGITSAINKVPVYSLGNIIGANIANICLVLGIGAILIKGLQVKKEVTKEDSIYMLIIAILPLILILDGILSRADGIVLVGFFVFYMTRLLHQNKIPKAERKEVSKKELAINIALFVISIYLLFFSSQIMISSGLSISTSLNFPIILIGIFSAVGTTLPELLFTMKSVVAYKGEMALGNVLGSVVVNSSLILGIVAIIYPIVLVNISLVLLSAIFLIFSLLLFTIFSRTGETINLKEALILIFVYLLFIFIAYGFGKVP
jgi:cation:H+ antiporter